MPSTLPEGYGKGKVFGGGVVGPVVRFDCESRDRRRLGFVLLDETTVNVAAPGQSGCLVAQVMLRRAGVLNLAPSGTSPPQRFLSADIKG